jgi:hypothetical protein
MSSAKLTLIGCNAFFENIGDDLFKGLTLPEGLAKKTLTDNILLQGGEFEVLYSDPWALQNFISVWADREAATFQRWVDALAIEYAPLENYDRHEDWTDTLDSDGTSNTTGTNDTSTSGTVTTDVSAYDSSSYQPKDKVTSSETIDNDTTENNTSTLDNEGVHTGRIHGNIGVTTSQQMLESELDLGYWNIYSRITDMFLKEFCIMIYS